MRGWEDAPEGLRERVADLCGEILGKNSLVADLGCGYGILLEYLREKGFECLGLEIDEEKVREVRRKGFGCVRCDLNGNVPLKNSSVDCVVATEVIEHLENPWRFLREVKRVLKPGGIAVITFPNFTDFISRLKFLFKTEFSYFIRKVPPGGHIQILPYWLFEYMAERCGFKVAEVKSHRTWIDRLKEKTVKHKIFLIFLMPLFLILYSLIRVGGGETESLLPENYIFVLRK